MFLDEVDGQFSAIYADLPWHFRTFSHKGESRSATRYYECMSLAEICKMPIQQLAAENCVLLLWVTDPFLIDAQEVIAAWGFAFKTVGFYWAKPNPRAPVAHFSQADFHSGTGYWTRANTEQCLLGTRDRPERKFKAVSKLIVSPRRAHSCKPNEADQRIEALVSGSCLEVFASSERTGWTAWGRERGLFPGPRAHVASLVG